MNANSEHDCAHDGAALLQACTGRHALTVFVTVGGRCLERLREDPVCR
jgi:hypothetical protein